MFFAPIPFFKVAPPVPVGISFRDSNTSTSSTINVPSSARSGDVLVLIDFAHSASTPTSVIPTGFWNVSNTSSTLVRLIASCKLADSDDPGRVLTGMSGSTTTNKHLYVLRGDQPLTEIRAVLGGDSGFISTDPSQQTIASASGVMPLVAFGVTTTSTAVTPNFTMNAIDNSITATKLSTGYKIFNNSPIDVTINTTDNGSDNKCMGFYLSASQSAYVAQPVYFDGVADYLTRGAGLSGAADTKLLSGSFWVKRYSTGIVEDFFVTATAAGGSTVRIRLNFQSTDHIRFFGNDTGGTTRLDLTTPVNSVSPDTWHHVCFCFDMADTAKRFVYIDDVSQSLTATTYTNTALDWTVGDAAIGADCTGSQKTYADFADFWMLPGTYLDMSVEANRRKFIDTNGDPVFLGENGQFPTGSTPLVFMSGDYAAWHTNKGTGGGFTEESAITQSFTSPSPNYQSPIYTATPVNFDGSTDYLTRGAGLTGAADSKLWTISFWAKLGVNSTTMPIITSATGVAGSTIRTRIARTSTNEYRIYGYNSAGTVILEIATSTTATIASGWQHILCSVDLTDTAKRHLYVNDTSNLTTITTYTNDTIDFTMADWSVGADPDGSPKFTGDIADLWFKPGTYIDFSVTANRREFIDTNGDPVDLGEWGEKPGLGQPLVFCSGIYSNWDSNKGTGGGFTVQGSLDASSTSPSPWYSPPTDVGISYLGAYGSNVKSKNFSFNGKNIGAAAADRKIIIAVEGAPPHEGYYADGITVDGSSATKILQANSSLFDTNIFIISKSSGTTADIVVSVNADNAFDRCSIAMWRMVGAANSTPYDTASSRTGDPTSINLGVLQYGGAIAYAAGGYHTPGVTLSGIDTIDFNNSSLITDTVVSGGHEAASSTKTLSLSADWSGTYAERALLGASWSPPLMLKGGNIRLLGSIIGDYGSMADAFDGQTIETGDNSASKSEGVADGYIGKTYSIRVHSAIAYGASGDGLCRLSSNPTMTLTLYGKQGTAPANSTDGTILGTSTFTDSDDSTGRTVSSNDTRTVWNHVWMRIQQSPSADCQPRLAELEIFEAVFG